MGDSTVPPSDRDSHAADSSAAGRPDTSGALSDGEAGCDFATPRDAALQRRFNVWLIAAMLTYAGSTAALRWRDAVPAAVPWVLVALTLLLAAVAVHRYLLFLRGADELLRKIQTEALGVGFGVGVAVSLFYPLLERLGAPHLPADGTALIMLVVWGAGSWLGTRRYRGGGAE